MHFERTGPGPGPGEQFLKFSLSQQAIEPAGRPAPRCIELPGRFRNNLNKRGGVSTRAINLSHHLEAAAVPPCRG